MKYYILDVLHICNDLGLRDQYFGKHTQKIANLSSSVDQTSDRIQIPIRKVTKKLVGPISMPCVTQCHEYEYTHWMSVRKSPQTWPNHAYKSSDRKYADGFITSTVGLSVIY